MIVQVENYLNGVGCRIVRHIRLDKPAPVEPLPLFEKPPEGLDPNGTPSAQPELPSEDENHPLAHEWNAMIVVGMDMNIPDPNHHSGFRKQRHNDEVIIPLPMATDAVHAFSLWDTHVIHPDGQFAPHALIYVNRHVARVQNALKEAARAAQKQQGGLILPPPDRAGMNQLRKGTPGSPFDPFNPPQRR